MKYLQSNYLVSLHHHITVKSNPSLQMRMFVSHSFIHLLTNSLSCSNRYVGNNCLIQSQIHYTSKYVVIDFGDSQDTCVDGMCDSDRRRGGCVMCSGERCLTCGSGYVLFDGRCVGCLWMEECVFNNSVEIECVDDGDLSHCKGGGGGEYVGCSEHVCINSRCKSGEMGENEECLIGVF